jgi:hypothetical protein
MILGVSPLAALGQPSEIQITNGPLAGAIVRVISKNACGDIKFAHGQSMISQERTNWVVSAKIGGVKTNMECRLSAHEYKTIVSKDGTDHTNSFFVFGVEVNTKPALWWICARRIGEPPPRDFKIFTTQAGDTYASYVDSNLMFYRVMELRDEISTWQELWKNNLENTDAIPSLEMRMLLGKYGRKLEIPYKASYYASVCEDIFEVNGELRTKVHGRNSLPKHTFALRNGRWEWVSSEGGDPYEEMTPIQIMDDYRRAISEQFEAETKKHYGQTNGAPVNNPSPDSGGHTNK